MGSAFVAWDESSSTNGREAALEGLFRSEYVRLVHVANNVLGDPAEAEDVAQEAFVLLHQRRQAGQEQSRLWLYRTATNLALTRLRSRKRRQRREAQYGRENDAVAVDPAEVVEMAEQRQLVRSAMLRLEARKARVLALRYGGLSYKEVAAALQVNVDQVGTLLRRAEQALGKELDRVTPV